MMTPLRTSTMAPPALMTDCPMRVDDGSTLVMTGYSTRIFDDSTRVDEDPFTRIDGHRTRRLGPHARVNFDFACVDDRLLR